jgi:transposase
MTKLMAGIDLHSNNIMVGLVDMEGKRVAHQKLPCELKQVLGFLAPYKEQLAQIAVESTYNWYWLVDGLHQAGYPAVLANPAKIDQYRGIKHADDKNDAFFLAELLRLDILPTGHVYDAQRRPVRDLLRRRLSLVRHRTALLLSFKSLYTRTTGQELRLRVVKAMEPAHGAGLYQHPANQLIARLQLQHPTTGRKHFRDRESRPAMHAQTLLLYATDDAAWSRSDPGHDHYDGGRPDRAL